MWASVRSSPQCSKKKLCDLPSRCKMKLGMHFPLYRFPWWFIYSTVWNATACNHWSTARTVQNELMRTIHVYTLMVSASSLKKVVIGWIMDIHLFYSLVSFYSCTCKSLYLDWEQKGIIIIFYFLYRMCSTFSIPVDENHRNWKKLSPFEYSNWIWRVL